MEYYKRNEETSLFPEIFLLGHIIKFKKKKAQKVHRLCLIYEKEGLNYQYVCYFTKNNTQTNFLNNYLC